jgi:hypothetical protein
VSLLIHALAQDQQLVFNQTQYTGLQLVELLGVVEMVVVDSHAIPQVHPTMRLIFGVVVEVVQVVLVKMVDHHLAHNHMVPQEMVVLV